MDTMETTVLQVQTVSTEATLQLDNNQLPLTSASTAHQDLLDLLEMLDLRDLLETMATMDSLVNLVETRLKDLQDLLDLQDSQVNQDNRDQLVNQVKFATFRDRPAHLDLLDHQDLLDNQVKPEDLEAHNQDRQALPEMLDSQDHQETLAHLVNQETTERLDTAEVATTAHRLALLQDIKLVLPKEAIQTVSSFRHLFLYLTPLLLHHSKI